MSFCIQAGWVCDTVGRCDLVLFADVQVILATEDQGCLRNLLSCQGLRFLWSWMVDCADISTSEALNFRIQVRKSTVPTGMLPNANSYL